MATDDSASSTLVEAAHKAAAELATVRDELRLRLRLGQMEAQSAWEEDVIPQLDRAEGRLKEVVNTLIKAGKSADDETRLKLHLALMEARDRWKSVEPQLQGLGERLRRSSEEALSKLPGDRAQLKAHLASMDAQDYLAKKRTEAETWLRDAGDAALRKTSEAAARLRDEISSVWSGPSKKG